MMLLFPPNTQNWALQSQYPSTPVSDMFITLSKQMCAPHWFWIFQKRRVWGCHGRPDTKGTRTSPSVGFPKTLRFPWECWTLLWAVTGWTLNISHVWSGKRKYEQQTQEGFNCFLALQIPVCTGLSHRACPPETPRSRLLFMPGSCAALTQGGAAASILFKVGWLVSQTILGLACTSLRSCCPPSYRSQ